jgi:hypothetical protein
MKGFQYLFLLFPLIGVALLAVGIFFRIHLSSRLKGCVSGVGEVIDNKIGVSGGSETAPIHYPQIQYTVGKQRHVIESKVGSMPRIKPGHRVAIMYRPENPAIAYVLKDHFIAANICVGLGLGSITMGSIVVFHLISG